MDSDLFWYLAGALVLAAVVLSAIGIRGKDTFPPSGGVLAGVIAVFALLVVATGAFAVAYAEDEQEHRDHELAMEEAEAAEAQPPAPPSDAPSIPAPAPGGSPSGEPAAAPAQTLDVTSPADGSLVFDPDAFEATAGEITFAYDNPSPVPHSIAIEDDQGELLDESDTVTGSATEASATFVPGEYLFFCTVTGHRESGMEGTLTVQ